MSDDFLDRFHRSMYGKSPDPEHEDNRHSREFLDGYAAGLTHAGENGLDGICDEWERRGSPNPLPPEFREWKRGFNAGKMFRAWNTASDRSDSSRAAAVEPGGANDSAEDLERPAPNVRVSDSPAETSTEG